MLVVLEKPSQNPKKEPKVALKTTSAITISHETEDKNVYTHTKQRI